MWCGVAVNRFGHRGNTCLSGWADAAPGCAVRGSNRQATGTNRQTIGADGQAIGTDGQATGSIREISPWDNAVANTSGKTLSRLH